MTQERLEQSVKNIAAMLNTRTPFTGLNEAAQISEDMQIIRQLVADQAKPANPEAKK